MTAKSSEFANKNVQFQLNTGGDGVLVLRQDKAESLDVSGYEGSVNELSSLTVTGQGGVKGTATTTSTTLRDGLISKAQNFHNQVGETISFKLSGIPFSFIGAGTADQATNASRFYAALQTQAGALTALGYQWNMDGTDKVAITRNGALGSGVIPFTDYSGSTDEPTFLSLTNAAFSVTGGTLQEGFSYYMGGSGCTNTAGETISMNIKGIPISFTAAGTGADVTNADRLHQALLSEQANLYAQGVWFEYNAGDDQVRLIQKDNVGTPISSYEGTDTAGYGHSMIALTNSMEVVLSRP